MKKTQMTYEQIKEVFYNTEKMNKCYGINVHFEAEITFTQDSFTKEYSEEARTYVISSNNKAFIPGMGGYSIYGSSLDGSDKGVRLEQYMADEKGGKDGWKIEKAFIRA